MNCRAHKPSTSNFNRRSQPTQVWASANDQDDVAYSAPISNISAWAGNNKKPLAAASALIAAAAFASPSFAVEPTAMVVSASSFMDKVYETGFYQAFSLVFVSEIGDKTFFIAGLLAMKAGRLVSFVGSVGALAVMTIISVLIGQIFHAVPPGISQGIPLDDIAAVLAFTFFGLKTLKDASEIEEGGESGMDEEYEEAVEAVDESRTIKEVTAW